MKINGNEVRPGNIIEHKGRLWRAVKISHTQPGKGGAYLQVELKDIKAGTKLNERFRSSESVELVRIDAQEYQFLYTEGEALVFMDTTTYDQISVDQELVGEAFPFLKENMVVKVSTYEGDIVAVELPKTVVMEVVEADPVIKGQTATSSYKPGKLENGIRIMIPPYIETGTKVVVNTIDATYVERAG